MREFMDFAVESAYLAGRLTLGYFRSGLKTEYKGDQSPVTVADREAEQLIRSRITETYPNHAIVGEEFGEAGEPGGYRWFIDPIDGTKSFIRGVPLYGVLVGLEKEGRIIAGASYFPALDEMIYAGEGMGCYWNGRRCSVSDTQTLADAFLGCTDPGAFRKYGLDEAWNRMMDATYYRVGWSDAYGHALVATGRLDIMMDPKMSPWDCGPFPVILREAGGYFGDWNGQESHLASPIVSTSNHLLESVLSSLKG